MAAPTLNDYELQYKDTGVLLNGTSAVPFWDVTKITGLVDFPEFDPKIQDLDGRHGSFVAATFFKHRTIIIDGTLYANVASVDASVQTLRSSLLPDNLDYPFYFKLPGQTQRYLNAKGIGFNCDIDTARRIGTAAFQVQLVAPDPRHYVDGTPVNWTTNVNFNLTNNGNVTLGPVILLTAASTTTASITVTNVATGQGVTLSFSVTASDALIIDLDKLTVRRGNTFVPTQFSLVATDFPVVAAGSTQAWKVVSNIGNGSISNNSVWI